MVPRLALSLLLACSRPVTSSPPVAASTPVASATPASQPPFAAAVAPTGIDRCPDAPETDNGYQDADGCPDQLPAEFAAISGVVDIHFDPRSDALTADSLAAVGRLSEALRRHPELLLELRVHIHAVGLEQRAHGRSHRQVEALERALSHRGAPRDRYRLIAMGAEQPVADNGTAAGRAQNERVEAAIVRTPDSDGDGFMDAFDPCPKDRGDQLVACPGPDGDGDGIDAPADVCPTAAETRNGHDDGDGCPDELPADLQQITGVIEGVRFEIDKDQLVPSSFAILDRLAAVLARHPLVRFELSAHTDPTAPVHYGRDLPARRAAAVKRYLIERGGVAGERIETRGAGADEPRDTNKTAAGRARNRRIELTILGQ